jgi:multimeric flavodoxin WrbA
MKRVIAISGSPRKNGNTERLIKEIVKSCNTSDSSIFRLEELNYQGCQGCYACRKNQTCVINDDMNILYNEIHNADLVILGTPIYMWQMSGQMKLFTDRLLPFLKPGFTSVFNPKGKDAILVFTQGYEKEVGFKEYIDQTKEMYKLLGFNILDVIIGAELKDPNEFYQNTTLIESAHIIGQKVK